MVFKGNTSTNVSSTAANIASEIAGFSIANKTGGSITIKVAVVYGSTIVYLLYGHTLAMGTSYVYSGNPITVPPNYNVYVEVSGDSDYYFSIK